MHSNIEKLINYACECLAVNKERLYVDDRNRDVVHIRHAVWKIIYDTMWPNITLVAMGAMFNKNHSTVINAIKEHDNRVMPKGGDKQYTALYNRLIAFCQREEKVSFSDGFVKAMDALREIPIYEQVIIRDAITNSIKTLNKKRREEVMRKVSKLITPPQI